MKVVGVVGMPAAGKGEVAAVAVSLGYRLIRFRTVVEAEAKRLGYHGPLALTKTGNHLRRTRGPDFFAKAIVSKIKKLKSRKVFVEGIRSPAELLYLEKSFPNFICIAIVAPQRLRFKRALGRARWDDPAELALLHKKDKLERSWGVPKAVRMADRILMNRGSLPSFRAAAKKLLLELSK